MAEQASSAELTDAVETELEELPGTDLPCLAGHPYQARRASAAIEYAAAMSTVTTQLARPRTVVRWHTITADVLV